jgi:TonB family protein
MPVLALVLAFAVAAAAAAPAQQPVSPAFELRRVRMGTDREMPTIERQVLPAYPAKPAADGIVDLEVVVGTTGAVIHSRVVKSPDVSGVIDRASLDALKEWRFKPAVKADGQQVASLVRLRLEFSPPVSAGQAGRVSVHLAPLRREFPPRWERLPSTVVVHDAKTAGIRYPAAIREVLPSYTADALRAKIQGAVQLEIVVLPDGTVGAARVTQSLDPRLDDEALYAARYWHFEPAQLDGQPVAINVALELTFRLH